MIIKLENGCYNLYDAKNELLGFIKVDPKRRFTESELYVGDTHYTLRREGQQINVFEGKKLISNLKVNVFTGSITAPTLNAKIKSAISLIWGTKLVDSNQRTILKIRNKNLLIDANTYIVKVSDPKIDPFGILLTMFGHIYGSGMKFETFFDYLKNKVHRLYSYIYRIQTTSY